MSEEEEKKSLLDKAVDLLTDKDEEEALQEAQAQLAAALEEAEKTKKDLAKLRISSAQDAKQSSGELFRQKKATEEAEKRALEAEARLQKLQARLDAMLRAQQAERQRKAMEQIAARRLEEARPKFIAEHTLTSKETLSHLSLQYYGSATKPYWMIIYEANKDVIGDNPNRVRPGLVIKIPELPEDMKKKK